MRAARTAFTRGWCDLCDAPCMSPPLLHLALAAGAWISLHVVVAGSPLRRVIARKIGEPGFAGLFSLLSLAGLVWLVLAYRAAAVVGINADLWLPGRALLWVPLLVMPLALLLFVGSVTVASPTSVGGEKLLQRDEPAHGILRITRHPMLWSFALWGLVHAVANGDAASLLLFAAIVVPALLGMASIDRKRARRDGAGRARFAAVTSIVPFAAIVAGRNRLVWQEIGLWRIGLALLLWAALAYFHGALIGGSALPW